MNGHDPLQDPPELADPSAAIEASESATRRRWTLAGVVVLMIVVYWLRLALLPFVIAVAIAFVASPAIRWLESRLRLPRWLAASLVFVGVLALLAAGIYWAQHVIVPQLEALIDDAPQLMRELFRRIFHADKAHILGQDVTAESMVASIIAAASGFLGGPATVLAASLAGVMMFFLTLFLLFFFMISGPRIARGVFWLVPPSQRPWVGEVARRMHPVLYRYVGGVIVIVVVTSFLSWIGLGLLLGVPHATVLSVAIGILETIPVIGPIISAALMATVVVAVGNLGIIIGVAIFALALRLFIDQLLGPIILGQAVRLHPVVILFAFLVGGTLYGILGVMLAVPVAATVKVALQTLYGETSERNQPRTAPPADGSS